MRPLDEATRRRMIRNEFGGINESFYNLYALTGDERDRWLAGFFYHNEVIDPLKEGRDDLGTKHTNTFIPKVLAEARNYELSGAKDSRALSEFSGIRWSHITRLLQDAAATRSIILIRSSSLNTCRAIPEKPAARITC